VPLPPISPRLDGVLLRVARADDHDDLVRLAELDDARPLAGPALIAEENGALVAALCLSTGRAVADPFVPSLHLVELLRQHAARDQPPRRDSRRPALPADRSHGGVLGRIKPRRLAENR
jgi:hypothetical protein